MNEDIPLLLFQGSRNDVCKHSQCSQRSVDQLGIHNNRHFFHVVLHDDDDIYDYELHKYE